MLDGSSRVELVPFDVTRDVLQLRAWLTRPHVARWWGDPDQALAEARQHPATTHALIAVDGRPVGYLCWQHPQAEELAEAGLSDLPADLVDVDILIGEPDFMGRGIGPRALSLLVDRLRAEGVSTVGLAGAADNQRALRAYAKAGFRPYRTFREGGQEMRYLIRAEAVV
jgi:aminoglycoside 6'-N-acetyltransferase